MLRQAVLALSTLCLAVSACAPTVKRTAEHIRLDKTNPERFICERSGTRPKVPAEYQIDWDAIAAAPDVGVALGIAMAEHGRFVASVRSREGVVAGYVLDIEGKLFTCWNNMTWQREFYEGLPAPSDSGGMAARAAEERVAAVVGPVSLPNGHTGVLAFRS